MVEKQQRMKIGFFVHDIYPFLTGGAEIQADLVASKLAKKHDVIVFLRGKSFKKSEMNGYKVVRIPEGKGKLIKGKYVWNSFWYVKKYHKDCDRFICFGPSGAIVSFMLNRVYKIPYLISVRGSDWYVNDSYITRFIKDKVYSFAKSIVVQTNKTRGDIGKVYPKLDIKVISNGVDLKEGYADGKYLLFVGRIHPVKGISYLVDALRDIKNSPKLVIIGDGDERVNLERYSKGLDVEFLGRLKHEEIINHMKNSYALVLPSVSEGLPNVILEAMSVGLPVIASSVGGIPDVVGNGKTGFLVKPRDVDGLAEKIRLLYSDKKMRDEMGKNAKEDVRKFSWGEVLKKWDDVLFGGVC